MDQIAHGAMAEVFRAKSYGVEGFEKLVVVKRMHPDLAAHQPFVDAYLREARMSVALSHAHVVQVLDLGREDETYYVAQELVMGHSLDTVIRKAYRRGVRLPVELAIFVGCGIARALDYAHRRKDAHGQSLKVVHRDVTPRSVMLSNEGEVKLADFGIALARRRLEAEGILEPRPSLMAPEILGSDDFAGDPRSDLYGLGVTLFMALSGHDPFLQPGAAHSYEAVRDRVLAGDAAMLRGLRDDAPPELIAVIERAMAVDPEARWPSAAHVFEELTGLLYAARRRVGSNDLGTWIRGLEAVPSLKPPPAPPPRATLRPAQFVTEAVADDAVEALDDVEAEEVAGEAVLDDDVLVGEAVLDDDVLVGEAVVAPAGDEVSIDLDVPLMVEAEAGARDDDPEVAGPWRELRDVVAAAVAGPVDPGTAQLLERFGATLLGDTPARSVWVFGLPYPSAQDPERAAQVAEVLRARGVALATFTVPFEADGTLCGDGLEPVLSAPWHERLHPGVIALDETLSLALEDHFAVGDGGFLGPRLETRLKAAGRKEPFRVLAEQLSKAASTGGRAVTLRGPSGAGKSHFLDEVGYRLRRMNHPVDWHLVTCTPAMAPKALAGFQAVLRALLTITETDDEAALRLKAQRLRQLGLNAEEVMALGGVLGITHVDGPSGGTRPLRVAVQKVVASLAGDRVGVLAIDGGENLDPISASILDELVAAAAQQKLLVLVATQPGRRYLWEDRPNHTGIELGAMGFEELRQLVGLRLGVTEVADALVATLAHDPERLPRDTVENLRAAQHAGLVRVVDRRVESDAALLDQRLRPMVKAGVLGRFARLPTLARRLLQAASVVGPRFALEQAAGLAGVDDATAAGVFDGLVSERWLEREEGSEALRFVGNTRAEVVEATLPEGLHRKLRGRVAAVSEQRLGARLDAFADTVAEHLVEAGETARAVAFFTRASRRQEAAGHLDRAVSSFVRAIELSEGQGSDETSLGRYVYLAELALVGPELEPALEALRRGAALADSLDRRAEQVVMLLALGDLVLRRGDAADALRVFERAGLVADRRGDAVARSLSQLGCGAVFAERGDFGRATRTLAPHEATLGEGHAGTVYQAIWQLAMARCRAASADLERAQAALARVEALRQAGTLAPRLRAWSDRVAVEVALAAHDTAGASERAARALMTAEDHDRPGLVQAAMLAGVAAWRLGDAVGAEQRFRQAYDAAAARSMVRYTARAAAWLAFLASARPALDAALAAIDAQGVTADAIEVRYLSGLLSVQLHETERARRELREAKMKAQATDQRVLAEACEVALRTTLGAAAP
ncbi:MAG: protein kinase [Myxococcales bacterium]|nr:protein kinase [Myxococcales bacterium]